MAYDPRFVANLILDAANEVRAEVSNLSINKIAYFVHGWYLAKYRKPLLDAKIEAWDYGPVVREIYREFKKYGSGPITEKAQRVNFQTMMQEVAQDLMSNEEFEFVKDAAKKYVILAPGKLVGISHEKGGPWDVVYNDQGRANPGMEISNKSILEHFDNASRH